MPMSSAPLSRAELTWGLNSYTISLSSPFRVTFFLFVLPDEFELQAMGVALADKLRLAAWVWLWQTYWVWLWHGTWRSVRVFLFTAYP